MTQHTYTPPTGKDWRIGILVIVVYVLAISLSAIWLLMDYWYLWLLIVVGGLIWIVNWHTQSYAYHCQNCEQEFEVSFWVNLISPHGVDRQGGWTWLKCPACQQRGRTRIVKIIADHE